MTTTDAEVKLQALLLVFETLLWLGLAGWCLNRGQEAWWGLVGTVGAVLLGCATGALAASGVEVVFHHTAHVAEKLAHTHVNTGLFLVRIAGVALLIAAFVLSRQDDSRPSGASKGT